MVEVGIQKIENLLFLLHSFQVLILHLYDINLSALSLHLLKKLIIIQYGHYEI